MMVLDWLVRVSMATGALTASGGHQATAPGWAIAGSGTVVSLDGPDDRPPDGGHAIDRVLDAVMRRGDDGLSRLRGQFALAISGPPGHPARVLRDPLGSHPLFYTRCGDEVLFAARPQTLLAQPGGSRALNRAAIADHLSKRWPLRQETFFEVIHRVPPGWQVVVSPTGVSAARYWNPVDPSGHIAFLADDEVERFDTLLELATARAFTGTRAGIFLSGGFDSVSVAAVAHDVAAARGARQAAALSIAFPALECNEEHVQASVAERLGLPLHLIDFDSAVGTTGLLEGGIALNRTLGAPLFNTWMPAYLTLLDTAVAEDVDTILTGEGGDEWLGTTPFLAADLWRRGDLPGLVALARTWKRSFRQDWATVARSVTWKYGLRPLAGQVCHRVAPEAWDARRAAKAVASTPPFIARDAGLHRTLLDRARLSLAAASPAGGFYAREAAVFLDHPLMSWLFEEQFAVGAPRGIRYVHPYWDPDLVAHMYRVSPARLNEGARTKALVRQTVDRRFPSLGFRRQRKITATQFFADLVRREGPPLAAAVSDFDGLASLGIVEPAAARTFLTQAWGGSPRSVGMAWTLVNMEYWVRGHA